MNLQFEIETLRNSIEAMDAQISALEKEIRANPNLIDTHSAKVAEMNNLILELAKLD